MNLNKINLFDYVHAAFEPNGVVVQLGGRYVPEQYNYAMRVAETLIGNEVELSVSVLEAETGVGKSLGYLIPCLCFVKLNESISEQIIISTFTRLLQKQILESDLKFSEKVLLGLGLDMPKFGYRMGREAFFSIERTKSTIKRLSTQYSHNVAYIEQLNAFYEFVEISCKDGTGSWLDWIDEYYVFPDHIYSKDICLLYGGTVDNDAYIKHINTSTNAAILLTNHATLIGYESITDFVDKAYMVITDECHHLDRLMTERSNKNLSIKSLSYLFSKAYLFEINASYIKDARTYVKAWIDSIHDYDTSQGGIEDFYLSSGSHKQWIVDQVDHVKKIQTWLQRLEKDIEKYKKKNQIRAEQVEVVELLQYALITLSHWGVENSFFHKAFVYSGHNRSCSIAVVNPIASRLFANTMRKLTPRLLITSATLTDVKGGEDGLSIMGDLGFDKSEMRFFNRFSPHRYGEMNFVLATRDVSVPTSYDKELRENRFNRIWVDYTVSMIAEAQKLGPTLVLCYSFDETKILTDAILEQGHNFKVISQEKGKKLLECVPNFLNERHGVLITPAGWDGLNLRDENGAQFLQNIVITRIPNPPKNQLEDHVAKEHMLSKGIPPHIVDNILWLKYINFCIRVMKQGLGRGIRSPRDKILIWIADPRMPKFNSPKAKPLIYAIPERFHGNYEKASIFELDGSYNITEEVDIVL